MIYNEKLNQFFADLFGKSITRRSSSIGSYNIDIVDKEARPIVEEMFRKFLNDNHDANIGQLQAKVKFYEEMIAKSNFKPFLITEEDDN